MNKFYKCISGPIVLIFIFIESVEIKENLLFTRLISNGNNTILLRTSLNFDNQKYLINELRNLNEIKKVSIRFNRQEPNLENQKFDQVKIQFTLKYYN